MGNRLVAVLVLVLGLGCHHHRQPTTALQLPWGTPVLRREVLPACTRARPPAVGRELAFQAAPLTVTAPTGFHRGTRHVHGRAERWSDSIESLTIAAGRGPVAESEAAGMPFEYITTTMRDTHGQVSEVRCDHCFHAADRCTTVLGGHPAVVSTGEVVYGFGKDTEAAMVAAWELAPDDWTWLMVAQSGESGARRLQEVIASARLH
jgi:hypothetical protein